MASVEFDDVHVDRGAQTVLRGIDLVVPDGGSVALLGASGSGKSTTLRALAGLEDLTGGRVLLDGADVSGVPTRDRDLSMVFQGAWMLPHRSVAGNLSFPLELRKTPRQERVRRIAAELRAFALNALGGRRPGTLSSGERHIAATAQSMVRAPSVLLMDEPCAQVDAASRHHVLRQIDEVRRGYGSTLLVATNDRRVAAALGDRTAVIEDGQIVQCAPFQVLWAEPATLGAADLVGEWSLVRLPAQVSTIPGERVRMRTALGSLRTWQRDIGQRSTVVIGVRPEEMEVVAAPDGDLRAVVTRVAPMGGQVVVELAPASPTSRDRAAQRPPAAPEEPVVAIAPAPGPRVGELVGLQPGAFHIFDGDGRALGVVRRP
ncbi:MAG TPA: ABC transporter ATP-binding protein [Nitriliruptoraceae bacterium]|nr:ABC transporter ATP-binding protein [Nitriliruptoraceae bacterium]